MPETHSDRSPANLAELAKALRTFSAERDWDQFHSPKNLVMALAVEVGELLEHFQWRTESESAHLPPDKAEAVKLEVADVSIYLTRLADKLDIDLLSAAGAKLAENARKYPVERARGLARKYTEL